MNTDIEYLVSQMTPGQLNAFINQSFPDLVGGNFMFKQGQTEQDKKKIIADKLSKAVASPAMNATQESVVGSLSKYVSPEVRQPQRTRTANVNQLPQELSVAQVEEQLRLNPTFQGRTEQEKTYVSLLKRMSRNVSDRPYVEESVYDNYIPETTDNTLSNQPISSYDFDSEAFNYSPEEVDTRSLIPSRIGIHTNLITGEVHDYNRGVIYNPATKQLRKLVEVVDPNTGKTRIARQAIGRQEGIPNLLTEQSNFIPFINTGDRELDRQQQQDAVDNQLTDGEGRFFGTANYQSKRDNSVPYKRGMGITPRVAGVGQEYSPEVMSRVGQGGFLNNAGSIILPNTWTGDDGNTVFSKGRGTATTIIYEGGKDGVAIPKISIPRVEGSGNELVSFEDAVKRQLISPEQYNNYINQASQTRFISANNMNSFSRDNVKLYETSDWNPETKREENHRATYMNPLTKEVFNVTQNGNFYLVRPAVSKEASGLPIRKRTTNLAQEMTDINRAMREGSRDNLVDIIRENPDNPGLEAFTRPVPAINPITGETINKYVHTGNSGRWVDEDNPQELFNYFNANQESQSDSMEALDLARGGRRTAGGKVTPSYPSLQETDYLGGRLGFNAEGNVVDVPSQELAVKGINNFTPASEFTANTSQLVRDTRTGKVIYDPNRTVYVRTANTGFDDGDFAVVPYKEDRYQKAPANLQVSRQQTIEGYEPGEVDVFQPYSVYPGDFANTQFYRFKTNPETPLRAYRVNEFGTPIPNEDGVIQEVLNSKGEPIQLPRSAQIANKAEFISQPRLMVQDFKGTTPDYQPIPDGMSYEEADRKGLLNPIFNARTVGLNSSYQIPLSKGVGLARVLDSSDPREQAAFAAQATRRQIPSLVQQGQSILADSSFTPEEKSTKVKELFAHPLEILGSDEVDALIKIAKKGESRPAFDRKYTIAPGRTAGIESPQYAQYTDLKTSPDDDTRRFWKENIPGIIPQGVIDGAYLPVTVTPRPVNAEGKKGWLHPDHVYTTESGREVRGDKAVNYVNAPLNLDNATTNYLPKSKREELELKGFDNDAIDNWYSANLNLARDNALANAKILIDGQYYDVTPQATVAEFNPVAGGNYAMAETRSQGRAARIDLPFKAGTNISEPTPEWIQRQAIAGNLSFNPDDYISPDDKAILNQKEVYNTGYEEPTDILGAINRVQQKKNRIDAVISNREQRAMNNLNEQVGSIVNGEYITQDSTPDLEALKAKSNYLADEINTARYAHNAIVNIEDSPEIVIKREGSPQQLEAFLSTANSVLGMETRDNSFRYRNNPEDKLTASVVGSLPNRYLPYEQAQELNQTKLYHPDDIEAIAANRDLTPAQVRSLENARLLPAYRTQQKVELPKVPTSNIVNLGRVTPFPEEVITTQQFVPAGNQVVSLSNQSVSDIVPGSSWQSTNQEVVDNPRMRRRNQTPGVTNSVFSMGGNAPNIPIEPDVRMTGGMNIPKWAIPATLGAVWLGLAANARRQQDEERRQQQSVSFR